MASAELPSCPRVLADWAFERFAPSVLGYLRRMMRDPDEAEALAQEVFCRVVQAKGTYPNESSLRAWLFRVARNLAFDHAKKSRPRPISTLEDRTDLERPVSSFVAVLEQDEEIAAMHAALAKLPEIYRSTLVLRFFEELTYEEIKAIEGVSESALRTRTQKGLSLLREALADEQGFESLKQ